MAQLYDVVIYCLVTLVCVAVTSALSPLNEPMDDYRVAKARLAEDLLRNKIVKYKLSPSSEHDAVNVTFTYWPFQILYLDEVGQALISVGYAEYSWRDENLAWNASEYDEVNYIKPSFPVWRPSVVVANAADDDSAYLNDSDALFLDHLGYFQIKAPVFIKSTCNLNLTYFPFDSQDCQITFMLFFDDVKLNFVKGNPSNLPNPHDIQGEWTITSRDLEVDDYYDGIPLIRCKFTLKRSPNFYLFNVLGPITVTSAMTSLVFWIPPGSGEKTSFLVTVYVSNSVFLNLVANTMPRNMSSVPRLTMFMVFIIVMSLFSMMATIFVMRVYQEELEDESRDNRDAIFDEIEELTIPKKTDGQTDEKPNPQPQPTNINIDWRNDSTVKMLQKLILRAANMIPLGKSSNGSKNVKRKQKRRKKGCYCCLRSTAWDMIFFFLFFATGVPAVFFLFTL